MTGVICNLQLEKLIETLHVDTSPSNAQLVLGVY